MTVTIDPDLTSATVTVSGRLDLRTATDVADLIDLLAPEAVTIDGNAIDTIEADGIAHLTGAIRRARSNGRTVAVDVHAAAALVELVFTVTGAVDLTDAGSTTEQSAAAA